MPAAQRFLLVIAFRVLCQRQVLDQKFGDAVAGSSVIGLNGVETTGAVEELVFNVVAEERAELETVTAQRLREIILKDERGLRDSPTEPDATVSDIRPCPSPQ